MHKVLCDKAPTGRVLDSYWPTSKKFRKTVKYELSSANWEPKKESQLLYSLSI